MSRIKNRSTLNVDVHYHNMIRLQIYSCIHGNHSSIIHTRNIYFCYIYINIYILESCHSALYIYISYTHIHGYDKVWSVSLWREHDKFRNIIILSFLSSTSMLSERNCHTLWLFSRYEILGVIKLSI